MNRLTRSMLPGVDAPGNSAQTVAPTKRATWEQAEGGPLPLGVTWIEEEQAFNFAVHAERADSVALLLFSATNLVDPVLAFRFDFLRNKSGRIWHCRIPIRDIGEARYYAYLVSGETVPQLHSFDPQKILVDPYARCVFFPPGFDRELAMREGPNAGRAPLGALTGHRQKFDWGGDRAPHHESDAVIYELHVKGFTKNPNSGVDASRAGTYAGLVEKIPYLQELGITVVELMPLFMATARVIADIQKASPPANANEVVAIGHQFWWEYRYPGLHVVTANELHVPVSDPQHPTPTFIKLLSADTDHSFWVPRLAGKTDLIPNHPNNMWIDPHETGLYLGQCAQYCGTQHAKMLLRVYVQPRDEFDRWIQQQREPASTSDVVREGQRVFQTTACINCHAVAGTVANGRFGPDLTHLMSRETIAAGAALNAPENLRLWIQKPDAIKPGSLMPAMELTDRELDAVTAYLETLK